MLYTLRFFSSKCSLFHNANLFGSCIIHILYTGCAKMKKKLFRRQRVNYSHETSVTLLQYVPNMCIIKTLSSRGGHYIRRRAIFRQIRHYAPYV